MKELGVVVVPPASKRLACGDIGECLCWTQRHSCSFEFVRPGWFLQSLRAPHFIYTVAAGHAQKSMTERLATNLGQTLHRTFALVNMVVVFLCVDAARVRCRDALFLKKNWPIY